MINYNYSYFLNKTFVCTYLVYAKYRRSLCIDMLCIRMTIGGIDHVTCSSTNKPVKIANWPVSLYTGRSRVQSLARSIPKKTLIGMVLMFVRVCDRPAGFSPLRTSYENSRELNLYIDANS